MKIYVRVSNPGISAGGKKKHIDGFDKINCIKNYVNEFGADNITIVGDRLSPVFRSQIEDMKADGHSNDYENIPSLNLRIVDVDNGTGAGTFRDALELAIDENDDYDPVMLLEDDFAFLPGARKATIEACKKYDTAFVTTYDHPDKYMNPEEGGNPLVKDHGEVTRLVRTESTHWKITNSTVMSFSTLTANLKLHYNALMKFSEGNITNSFGFFMEMAQRGVACISSVPGLSTHLEESWLSPYVDWKNFNYYSHMPKTKLPNKHEDTNNFSM